MHFTHHRHPPPDIHSLHAFGIFHGSLLKVIYDKFMLLQYIIL